jgi:protein-tyrosine kinase
MENIRQAIERAKAAQGGEGDEIYLDHGRGEGDFVGAPRKPGARSQEVTLKSAYLQANRIVTHLPNDPRSRAFDMLRTQILQTMDLKGWKILAVTSPTANCGKTVTSVNLALSVARQPQRSVLLVDFDFYKPKVAASLGLRWPNEGVIGVLSGRTTLPGAMINARIGDQRLFVLPTKATTGSSELISSQAMATLMQGLSRNYQSGTIIIDLPPILVGDDVISLLPRVDCVLLVVAVGISTPAQIEECNRHLQSAEVVRVVVNKVPEATLNYYYY